jgi:hypothetical protein
MTITWFAAYPPEIGMIVELNGTKYKVVSVDGNKVVLE